MARKVWVSIMCSRCYGLNDRAPRRSTCQRCAHAEHNEAENAMIRKQAEIFFASPAWKEQARKL